MERENILKMAKYICFPYRNKVYGSKYDNSGRDIHKLPIFKDKDVLYSNMPGNEHHYTTEYTYKYVLPLVNELIGFGFSQNDFHLVPLILEKDTIITNKFNASLDIAKLFFALLVIAIHTEPFGFSFLLDKALGVITRCALFLCNEQLFVF